MSKVRRFAVAAAALSAVLFAGAAWADSPDYATVKSGDISHIDYWRTKVAFVALEEAVKTGQPGVSLELACRGFVTSVDAAAKQFPAHEDLAKWRARAEEIRKKLLAAPLTPGNWSKDFAWAYPNFTMAWANYHCGKMLLAESALPEANARIHFAVVQFTFLGKSVDNFPEDLKKWVATAKPEAEKLDEEIAAKIAGKTLGDPFAGKRTKAGDLSHIDYWRGKASMTMLDEAVATHQPGKPIAQACASFLRDCDGYLTQFPDSLEIPKWKARAEAIRAGLDGTDGAWKNGFPWMNGNYERAWANYYSGKMLLAEGKTKDAYGVLQFAVTQFRAMNAAKVAFSAEAQKWIADSEPDCEKLYKEAGEKFKAERFTKKKKTATP